MVTVYPDTLAISQPLGTIKRANDSRDAILTGHNGGMRSSAAAIYQTLESDLGSALALAASLVFISFGFLLLLRLITRGRIAHPLL